jgi:hypothetical protein
VAAVGLIRQGSPASVVAGQDAAGWTDLGFREPTAPAIGDGSAFKLLSDMTKWSS